MLKEKHDEILEAMWTAEENKKFSIDEIKKRCAIEFIDEDLAELESMDLIVKNKNTILFSSKGKELAENIMRRHRLAEVLMSSILKLKNSEMERVACQVEHYLVPEVEESICTLLGHPEICPDGRPIPKGRCCHNGLKEVTNIVVSLNELPHT